MYKVMLVEDEMPIRNIISRMIDWNQLGFDLVFQADDGQSALEFLEDHQVDLIITDISMPFMDGLELCRHLNRLHPSITIVILTGHNEFEYAKQAIDLNVSTYLLKPITKDKFTSSLSEIKDKMDRHLLEQKDIRFLRDQYRKSRELLRNKFLFNLILGYSQSYDDAAMEELGLSLNAPYYRIVVMELEDRRVSETEFWGEDRPLLEFAIFNLASEMMAYVDQDIIFIGPGNQICMVIKVQQKDDEEATNKVAACLEDLVQQIERLFHIDATVGISDVYQELTDLSIGYKDARVALEYKVLEGSEKVIFKSNVEKKSAFTFNKVEEQLTRLEYSIKVGDYQNVSKIIGFIFSSVVYSKIDIHEFRTFLLKLTITITKAYDDIRPKGEEEELVDYSFFKNVFEITDIDKLKAYYIDFCTKLSARIQSIRDDEEKNHIKQACDYIGQHYDDPFLNQEQVCNILYLSPGHFSRLFKKSTGETFVDYLTRIRMDKAKYLLANTDQKMYEISRAIGYEDPNYFSYNFKKHTKVTPSEWRKKVGEASET